VEDEEGVMQYMLLVYWDEGAQADSTKEQKTETFAAYSAYAEAMKKAGVHRAGHGLQATSTATVIRAPDGKAKALNGPYAESREQLGGYFLIDVPDLDSAQAWAARCPGAQRGAVEVRPLMIY
jgi:hypothetical protein